MEARGLAPAQAASLLRPARAFLLSTCAAECLIVVPNVAAELYLAEDGPHVAVCRICLFLARLSFLFVPLVSRLFRSCTTTRRRLDAMARDVFGSACGSMEPSRGLATALAGWYLISTPMHDAFGAQSMDGPAETDASKAAPQASQGDMLVPCIILMSANICLFLCDALMLTIAPLLRHDNGSARAAVQPVSYAQVLVYGSLDDETRTEKEPEAGQTCVICLADLEAGEKVARLPCSHMFHSDCVTEWLSRHGSCPLRCPGLVLPAPSEEDWARRLRERISLRGAGAISSVDSMEAEDGSAAGSADSLATERLEQEFLSLPSAVPAPDEERLARLLWDESSLSDASGLRQLASGSERPQDPRLWSLEQLPTQDRARPDS